MGHGKIVLETERLILTEMTEADQDEAVRLYYQVNGIINRFADLDGFDGTMNKLVWQEMNRDTLNWVIRDKAGVFLGYVCMQHMSLESPELGLDLFKEYRNKGYGPEVIEAFVPWFKHIYSVEKIKVRVAKENSHCLHVMEKLGATYAGSEQLFSKSITDALQEYLPEHDISELDETIVVFYL